ncbi:MAG: glycoside hydrolase family 97 protein [Lentimicrobiaceae bacterium]|nr:glycoside hydrolase family 97 protein [Lentimicrobiaceae bacterium]
MFFKPGVLIGQPFRVGSPDNTIQAVIDTRESITATVFYQGEQVMKLSDIAMIIRDKGTIGQGAAVRSHRLTSMDTVLIPVVKQKSERISDQCNELEIRFKGDYSLVFRVYDDGFAYRFHTRFDGDIIVEDEKCLLGFPGQTHIYFPEEQSFFSHNERAYLYLPVDSITPGRFCSLPALVESPGGTKILLTESSLEDYPGMWLTGKGDHTLVPLFPAYPRTVEQTRDRDVRVVNRYDYIAKTAGTRDFPWRIMVIAGNDGQLISNQLPWLLSSPCRIKDPSWIKPGKVAWDWWNANNIYGVDFKSGVNTETYKYYIDFASDHGIEYVILDEGWYKLGNLLEIIPEINIQEIVRYGNEKNVGIILWVIWKTLDDQLQEALDQFAAWGVKGIKVDFMQRDDQPMVEYYWKIARKAASRKLLVDFHGAYKPSGLNRTWPNVLTGEGVRGLEWNKWSDVITPEHDVTLPFIRMAAGPMDYTPGAMLNAQQEQFHPVFDRPMSQGTRCHQLAMYIVYESPLQMLADSPSNYLKENECMEFLSEVPSVWDETVVLDAKVGDYVIVARRSGSRWFLGGMTDWSSREFTIDLSFLSGDTYEYELYQDGWNSDRFAGDFSKVSGRISSHDQLTVHMSPGGGVAVVLTSVHD